MENISFYIILFFVSVIGYFVCNKIASKKEDVLTHQRKRDLILGNVLPNLKSPNYNEEQYYSMILDRYKMALIVSGQRPESTFELSHEVSSVSPRVKEDCDTFIPRMKSICKHEYQIDIDELVRGDKDKADLLKLNS